MLKFWTKNALIEFNLQNVLKNLLNLKSAPFNLCNFKTLQNNQKCLNLRPEIPDSDIYWVEFLKKV